MKTGSLNVILATMLLLGLLPLAALSAPAVGTDVTPTPGQPVPSVPPEGQKENVSATLVAASWDALPPEVQAKVDPRLLAELQGKVLPAHLGGGHMQAERRPAVGKPLEKTRFLVYLRARANLEAVAQQRFATRVERHQAVYNTLLNTARSTQGPVQAILNARASRGDVAAYQPFYIFNGFAVEGNLETIVELAQRDDVERVVANYPLVPLWKGEGAAISPPSHLGALHPDNWNIDLVDAERVWSELGVTGQGAVVGGFDTGVDWTHPALQERYRGYRPAGSNHNYNWFEADTKLYEDGDLGPSMSSQPYDCGEHGTHTMGTMVGDGGTPGRQVGMAPGAQWIAAPGVCEGSSPGGIGDDIGGMKTFQWFLCPTDLSGALATADCSRAPDVINNSWGSANPADDTFRPILQALRAAGIAPVFAAGNPSAGPGSIGAPANVPEAITVGATDAGDQVAGFSGRGPSFYEGEQKPELSAPGVDVNSTVPGGGYSGPTWSGTSIAAPHVAGLVALMVSADLQDGYHDLTVDELERFMEYTAVDLGASGPDDDYGYGRIDAYRAVRWVRSAGDLQGSVRDATTRALIAGATIRGVNSPSGDVFATHTDASGQYSTTVPAGTYDVMVEAWGYQGGAFLGQTVLTGTLSIADFALSALPTARLTGRVLSGTVPVSGALVYVAANPAIRYTSGANGAYTLTLPAGTHGMVVQASAYRILREDVSVVLGGSTHTFSLTPAPTILLVDADTYAGWFFGWPVHHFFRWSLDRENYLYDLWRVQYTTFHDTRISPDGSVAYGIPSLATLGTYDLVMWAHGGGRWGTTGSTVGMGADDELMAYLDGGGRLIISGQDLGQDAGTTFYDDYLHASWVTDLAAGEGDTVSGHGFLAGLNLPITNASLHEYANGFTYLRPDGVAPRDGAASPVLVYNNGNGAAALAIDPCDASYRAVYFALGYENIGPRAANRDPAIAEVLDRSIGWAVGTRPSYGVSVAITPARQMDLPGSIVRYDLGISNTGNQAATYRLRLSGNAWPTRILSGTAEVTSPLAILPCTRQDLVLEVEIPTTASINDADTVTVTGSRDPAGTPSHSVNVTTIAASQWQAEASMPTARYRLAAAAVPGSHHYYAIGGWGGGWWDVPMDANERYDACTGEWEVMRPLPKALANVGAAALNGKVYVVGGMDQNERHQDAVYVYDPATDAWSAAAELPEALCGVALASAGGKLYAFGGVTTYGGHSDRAYRYDPTTDAWASVASLPRGGRAYAAAAELSGRIYVVGGWPNERTVEVYDPATGGWSIAAPMRIGRQSPGMVATPDGYLYVSGGGSGWEGLASAERYDPATGTWEAISALNVGNRAGTASAYAAGKIWTVGGVGWDGLTTAANESLNLFDAFCRSSKFAWQGTVQPGGRITYTVEMRADAAGPISASLVDPIPAGTTFAGFGPNRPGARYDSARNQVTWSGTIPARSSPLTFTFGVNVNSLGWAHGSPVTNVATFSDGSGRVFTRTQVSLVEFPDASPSAKRVNKGEAVAGEALTYTIRVENRSTFSGTFSLRDPIPTGTSYVPGSLTSSLGVGGYSPAQQAITWTGRLPSGHTYANTSDDYEWGDSFDNGTLPGVGFDWVEISSTGTPIGFNGLDDGYGYPIVLPFSFPFYGTDYTDMAVATNGTVYFEDWYMGFQNTPIPSGNNYEVNAFIALLWDDLYVSPGTVYYEVQGSAPNRRVVIEYYQVSSCCPSPDYGTWEVILYENGAILMQYLDVTFGDARDYGAQATVGIQNSPTQGLQYSYNTPALSGGLAIVFLPPGASWRSETDYADVTFAVRTGPAWPVNGWLTNTATITGPYGPLQRSAGTRINSLDLSGSVKTADKAEAVPGEVVRYTLLLKHDGLLNATGVMLTDPIPPGLAYVPGSLTYTLGAARYHTATNTIIWTGALPTLSQHSAEVSFAVTLTTLLRDSTPVTNVAHLNDGYGNLYGLEAVFVERGSGLTASFKQADPLRVLPGGTITYTIYLHNSGSSPTTGQVQDALPPGLTYEAGSLLCGSGSCTYGAGKITWTGEIPPRSMVPVRFRAAVPANVAHGDRITNTAIVTDTASGFACPVLAAVTVVEYPDENSRFLPLVMRH